MQKKLLLPIIALIITPILIMIGLHLHNEIVINNQEIIQYKTPIGIYSEEKENLQRDWITRFKTIRINHSIQKYEIKCYQIITIDENVTFHIENTLDCHLNTITQKYKEYLEEKRRAEERAARAIVYEQLANSGVITTYGDISTSRLYLLYDYYLKIPQNVRNVFETNGWKIILTTESLSYKFYRGIYNSVLGVTAYIPKEVYIDNRDIACKTAVGHEIGHAIDHQLGFLSGKAEFIAIYREEKDNFVEIGATDSQQAKSSTIEYFAEAFQQTILYPSSCKKNTPKTYEYMINLINNM